MLAFPVEERSLGILEELVYGAGRGGKHRGT